VVVVNTDRVKADEQTRVAWLCALIGAWGVFNGFAIFILWTMPAPGQTIWSFVLGLAAAAVASWVIESLRERLRPPEHAEDAQTPKRTRIARLVLTLVSLATFELFIVASERSLDVFSSAGDRGDLRADLLGPSLLNLGGETRDLIALAVMWVLAGAALCGALASVVMLPRSKPIAERSRDGLGAGILAGALAAPGLVLLYVLGTRVVLAIGLALFEPALWQQHADALAPRELLEHRPGVETPWPVAAWYVAFQIIGPLFTAGVPGKLAAAAAVLVLYAIGKRFKVWWPFALFILAVVVAVAAPLSFDLPDVLQLPLLAAIVWVVPGAILGAAAPLLENPSQRARLWASASVVMGAIVLAVTLLNFSRDKEFLAAGIALVGVGAVLLRRDDLQIGWPFLAIAVSLATSSATAVVLHVSASFHSVLTNVAKINALPASVAGDPNNLIHDLKYESAYVAGTLYGLRYRDPAERERLLDAAKAAALARRDTVLGYTLHAQNHAIAVEPILYARCRSEDRTFLYGPPKNICFGASQRALVSMTFVGFLRPPLANASDAQVLARIRRDQRAIRAARAGPHFLNNVSIGKYSVWSEVGDDEDRLYQTAQRYAALDAEIAAEYAVAENDRKIAAALKAQSDKTWGRNDYPEKLELAMAGSVAFWMTVALLAAWQSRRNAEAAGAEEELLGHEPGTAPDAVDAVKPVLDGEPEA
jgi:hypothetical protein